MFVIFIILVIIVGSSSLNRLAELLFLLLSLPSFVIFAIFVIFVTQVLNKCFGVLFSFAIACISGHFSPVLNQLSHRCVLLALRNVVICAFYL